MASSEAARRNHDELFPGLAPGDPARMAARIITSVDTEPAPLRTVLGSQALQTTLSTLRKRIADFETQTELAASTDFPPGESRARLPPCSSEISG